METVTSGGKVIKLNNCFFLHLEAAVQKSKTLELIEPFVQSHTPAEFSITLATHSHGQSQNWLRRLIPVLMSHKEEARNIAAFHFCMEAEIKNKVFFHLLNTVCFWCFQLRLKVSDG